MLFHIAESHSETGRRTPRPTSTAYTYFHLLATRQERVSPRPVRDSGAVTRPLFAVIVSACIESTAASSMLAFFGANGNTKEKDFEEADK